MIRAPSSPVRQCAMALLGMLAGASCNEADSPTVPVDAPAVPSGTATLADSVAPVDSLDPTLASVTYSGLPFGPFGLFASATTFEWGPAPFTLSQDNTFANTIITRINTARQKRHRLVLAMTGGPSSNFKTNGKFDLSKWKRRMNTFNTSAIRSAVAAAVSDGTIVGNSIMDEPETRQWGGVMTKPLLDNMAAYVKGIFPTLPVGVNHGPPGYKWRSWERYRVVDYTVNQYAWWITSGNVASWRDAVVARARYEGLRPAFSMNLLDGGVQDRRGSWDCSGTGGKGTYYPNCRMTSDQVKNWGRAIGPSGCFLLAWKYDGAFVAKSSNQDAFRSVASLLGGTSRRSCRRS